jgi:CRISPR-associated protein Csm2
MRNDRGPRPGQNFQDPQNPPRGPQGQNKSDRVKALLGSIEAVSYVSADNPGPQFVDSDAQKQAKELEALPTSQLRRFYGMVTAFKRRLELDDKIGDGDVQALIAHLKASAAYAAMRNQQQRLTRSFEELVRFFTAHANSVKTRKQYLIFCRHFEAVVAYHKVFGKD